MSPEQVRGLPIDSRTDLFSLGCVLYELLAGCPAAAGDTSSDVLAAVLTRTPPPLSTRRPECPTALVCIIDRALTKDREQRYQSAEQILSDLKRAIQGTQMGGAGLLERTPENIAVRRVFSTDGHPATKRFGSP